MTWAFIHFCPEITKSYIYTHSSQFNGLANLGLLVPSRLAPSPVSIRPVYTTVRHTIPYSSETGQGQCCARYFLNILFGRYFYIIYQLYKSH